MKIQLAIFLKAPRAGLVKTRLAQEIGAQQAVRIYRLLAERALAAVHASGYSAVVWYTPADAEAEMRRWVGAQWILRPQASGDLGARMSAAARAVSPGQGWICIGGDCAGLTEEHLRAAATALEDSEAVLGPAVDGGYYLIGGRTPLPDLMTAMPWSTDRLLDATRRRLAEQGVSWTELPVLRDVDTAADARLAGLLT